jgi:hypothetical protein
VGESSGHTTRTSWVFHRRLTAGEREPALRRRPQIAQDEDGLSGNSPYGSQGTWQCTGDLVRLPLLARSSLAVADPTLRTTAISVPAFVAYTVQQPLHHAFVALGSVGVSPGAPTAAMGWSRSDEGAAGLLLVPTALAMAPTVSASGAPLSMRAAHLAGRV